jgi:hypothetical protein
LLDTAAYHPRAAKPGLVSGTGVRPTSFIVSPLLQLLESFYLRHRPKGVAFVGSAKYCVSVGRSPRSGSATIEGFTQSHSGDTDTSTYSSYFGWGKFLIAEFDCPGDEQPSERQWIGFVRLAARVQRLLDDPADQPDIPTADVPVLKPHPTGPQPGPLRAEALLEKDAE